MTTYVALLRAINLGPTRKLPMGQVKDALATAGFAGLDTYLATGNVRLEAPDGRAADVIRGEVAAALSEAAGFDVPVVLLTATELREAHTEAHALDDGPAGEADRRYVAFLPATAADAVRAELAAWSEEHPGEGAYAGARHLHWWTDGPTTEAVIFKAATLKRLGIADATSRTLKVVDTLVKKWC